MFGAKLIFFIINNLFYLDEFLCVLSDVPTVITSLVLYFQEAKAKLAAKQLEGFFVIFFFGILLHEFGFIPASALTIF